MSDEQKHKPGEVVWHPHGILIYGPAPMGDFGRYMSALCKIGLTVGYPDIGHCYGALIAAPYPGHALAWRRELALSCKGDAELAAVIIGENWPPEGDDDDDDDE